MRRHEERSTRTDAYLVASMGLLRIAIQPIAGGESQRNSNVP
jgi:hypothetical protein